jgi:hypothetical protein
MLTVIITLWNYSYPAKIAHLWRLVSVNTMKKWRCRHLTAAVHPSSSVPILCWLICNALNYRPHPCNAACHTLPAIWGGILEVVMGWDAVAWSFDNEHLVDCDTIVPTHTVMHPGCTSKASQSNITVWAQRSVGQVKIGIK